MTAADSAKIYRALPLSPLFCDLGLCDKDSAEDVILGSRTSIVTRPGPCFSARYGSRFRGARQ